MFPSSSSLTDYIDIISFPSTAATSWTLELRFGKKYTFSELFFKIAGFVEMTGRNDAGCNFLIGSTLHQSKPFL